ncbi:UPF0262 family protein [Acidiphilium sp.]|uniref:UPF0262 family protein n=1 Tax=Acidiphilium sp. TaxID=527 RepID=UPI003CFCAA92
MAEGGTPTGGKLIRVVLDDDANGLTPMQEADRNQAIVDLAADNNFALASDPGRQTILHLSVQDGRLVFDIRSEADETLQILVLAPGPFRSMIRDYQMLLDSYAAAVAEGREARIQAIDMGRRGLHNEGADLVMARLEGKILLDFDTARRIFTLVCALHRRM